MHDRRFQRCPAAFRAANAGVRTALLGGLIICGLACSEAACAEEGEFVAFDSSENEPITRYGAKHTELPPVSGYLDFTLTLPLQYRPLALALPAGTDGEEGVLAQRSLAVTFEVDKPFRKHWSLVARLASYNTELLDPLLGVEYERPLRHGLTLTALQAFTLPISPLSRLGGRLTTFDEVVHLGYQHGNWAPYAQVEGSYSLFSNYLAAVRGQSSPVPASSTPVPVDQDTYGFGGGIQRYLGDGKWIVGASANAERLHFHEPPLPALWASSLSPCSVTYLPADGYYLEGTFLILQQSKLIIWPDEPLLLLGGGLVF